jgi:hypothetical protein
VDFVVTGILIGAILVVAGTGMRDFGPRTRPRIVRNDNKSLEPEILVRAWRRFCQSAGTLVTTLGLAIVLATVVAMVFDLSDRAGSITVATSVAVSAAVLVFAVLTMPNHYRRGGFDPVTRVAVIKLPPATIIEHEVVVPLANINTDSGDDLFANLAGPERPVSDAALPSDDEAQLHVAESLVDGLSQQNPAGTPFEADRDYSVSAERDPGALQSATIDKSEPGPDSLISDPLASQTPRRRLSPLSGRRLTERLRDEERAVEPAAANVPVPESIYAEPAIDPDEELPPWNAPPRQESPRPAQARSRTQPVPPASNPPQPRRGQSAAGFESNLFADLDVSSGEDETGGSFRSRLLSDLTGQDSGDGTPRADVLLDEFSLPEQPNPVKPDAENSR